VQESAKSNLTDRPTRISYLQLRIHSWSSQREEEPLKAEVEESVLLGAITRQGLVKTQQTGKI
jgi:hypothetical protein